MLPLILGGVALVGTVAWLFSSHDDAKPVPRSIVDSVARALKSGDPQVMRDVAATIRKAGFTSQATSLEGAATELEAAIRSTPTTKPGKAAPMVTGRGGVNPAPRADSASARRQAGQLAQLLSSMTTGEARSSADVKAAVTDYELLEKRRGFYVGNIDGLYGPKAALTLAQDHGIVPPHPLHWPKRDPAGAKSVYRQQLARYADADPQRREEWQQAMHVETD